MDYSVGTSATGTYPVAVATNDLDNDGNLDIVVANSGISASGKSYGTWSIGVLSYLSTSWVFM